ncbi:hypothetical protein PHLGIDRAFT_393030 [Phlebiopsis gigantea 11061_1 CR5-6]|uniref:Fungal-type protein kinase domain-containing protein n=1 Tax=Phlebiopsis gigantea (strain 11061_1 CR5-6) TaxID=745531 RepID=A0A0C3NS28_PHLG1|nr:hypothetical protein PHLGIDRAFT_393030 [Phlebiopsis gigantea 11061_1 CR5-6]
MDFCHMQRVLRGLDHRITRNYPIQSFIRDVWGEEPTSIQLSPEAKSKCVLPKPLRKLLSCYNERTLRRTVARPLDEERDAAELVWQETPPATYGYSVQPAWEEVAALDETDWLQMQAFIEITGHLHSKEADVDMKTVVEEDCLIPHAEMKTAELLLALMSSNVRSYTTGIAIRDFVATFWYADRMGVVTSKAFHILHEPYHLWIAGVAMAKARTTPMGWCPLITFTSARHVDFRQARLNADHVQDAQGLRLDGVTLKSTGDEITLRTAMDIVGRGTAVLQVVATGKTKLEFGSDPLVVKMIWATQHNHSEETIVRSVRRSLKHSKKQYLPFITDLKCSMELSMEDLDLPRAHMSIPIPADERVFRMQIMPHYLPLVTVESVADFRTIFQDVVEAHYWAFKTSGILHRDICINNIMLYYRDGKPYGVLTGWHLAGGVIPRGQPPSARRRFGSKPFISADAYAQWWTGEHLYRFDLESFYYVLAAFCAGFDPDRHTIRLPEKWLEESKNGKADVRRNLLKYLEGLLQYAAPDYHALAWEWVRALGQLFHKTIRSKYAELNSMHAIHMDAVKNGDTALAQETSSLMEQYLEDRDKEVTYERFLRCISIDDPSGNPD